MNIDEKTSKVETYLSQWVDSFCQKWHDFYDETSYYRDSATGIYKLKHGSGLLGVLNTISEFPLSLFVYQSILFKEKTVIPYIHFSC